MTLSRFATVFILLTGVLASQSAGSELIRSLLVQVRCGQDFGGGLIFSADRNRVNIMTADHVVRSCRDSGNVKVIFADRIGRPLGWRGT